jgi:hypothetical protein
MGKVSFFLLIICFLILEPMCHGQSHEVTDPRLELRNNNLYISYDILNSKASDLFSVNMRITDVTGGEIEARALSGDIGEEVSGGSNKQIVWDLTADEILMNARIYVKIYATAIVPAATDPVITLQEDDDPVGDFKEESAVTRDADEGLGLPTNEIQNYNRTFLILQSLPLPGLGLSRFTGKPHWIRGVVGYGCIAGSIGLNRAAIDTYKQIPGYPEYADKSDLFEKSQRQDNISEVLAYAAIGIWAGDLIWTIVGTSDLNMRSLSGETNGFSIRTTIDPLSYTPLLGIRYAF